MYSGSLSPQITIPTGITLRSITLIDNIFTNTVNESQLSGNLTFSISDHVAIFLICPELTMNKERKNHNIKGATKNSLEPNLEKI